MKFKHYLEVTLTIFSCLISTAGWAKTYEPFGPFTTRNQNPIYLQTLNLTPQRATVLPKHQMEVRIDSAYSNAFEQGASATNSMMEDMEIWRLGLHTDYGIGKNMEVGIEIPLLQLWSGFLDPFIQDFHNFFGFPNAGRENWPNNQFHFWFASGGATIYNVSSQTMNLGDISLHFKHHVVDEGRANPALAWFFDLKFPTGQRSKGLGNGGLDYGFGLALEKNYKRLHGYLNTAYYVSGRDDSLEPFLNRSFLSYMAGVELTLLPTWSLIAQVDGGTPLGTGTGMGEWDGVPLDLVIGFKGKEDKLFFGNDFIWQVAFSEDVLSTGPSVDFSVFLSVGVRFGVKGSTSLGREKGNMLLQRPELSL